MSSARPLDTPPETTVTNAWPAILLAAWGGLAAMAEGLALAGMGFGDATVGAPIRSIPIFHLSAELLMAVVPAVGAVAWWQGRRWGPSLVLFGLGTWVYAVANAAAWAVVNEPALLPIFTVSIFIVVFFGAPLIFRPATVAFGPRTRFRTAALIVLVLFMFQVFGVWAMYFLGGTMSRVLTERADDSVYLVRTLSGELPLVLAAGVGAWAWLRRRAWAPGLVLLAAGMLFYAGLNNFGTAVVGSAWRAVHCAATLVVSLLLLRQAHAAYTVATGAAKRNR